MCEPKAADRDATRDAETIKLLAYALNDMVELARRAGCEADADGNFIDARDALARVSHLFVS
jgi:citrate lyase beta subunit